ncbi:LysM peptidoglycan-binding domain-containing protein [Salirhabdus salicampi]|uniref:LysM peptidoglycan-binding domain-containing protein n=1 Tax=Salirhabdus salicampi TaxID=476102 RepID=UPI0020C36016|nr:SafA/ExsA family spore coat assembly protein [Salirhabdus salicampi]
MKIHVVQRGDTLFKIAQKYGVDVDTLKEMNAQLSDPEQIMAGMKLKIPTVTKPVRKEVDEQETCNHAEHPYKDDSPKPMPVIKEDDNRGDMFDKEMKPYSGKNGSMKNDDKENKDDKVNFPQMPPFPKDDHMTDKSFPTVPFMQPYFFGNPSQGHMQGLGHKMPQQMQQMPPQFQQQMPQQFQQHMNPQQFQQPYAQEEDKGFLPFVDDTSKKFELPKMPDKVEYPQQKSNVQQGQGQQQMGSPFQQNIPSQQYQQQFPMSPPQSYYQTQPGYHGDGFYPQQFQQQMPQHPGQQFQQQMPQYPGQQFQQQMPQYPGQQFQQPMPQQPDQNFQQNPVRDEE